MTKRTRRNHSPAFKAKVALAAERKTMIDRTHALPVSRQARAWADEPGHL